MKILTLVDGSECSAKAVDYVTTRPDFFQGKDSLQLLHVHPKVPGGLAASIVGNDAINAVVTRRHGDNGIVVITAPQ